MAQSSSAQPDASTAKAARPWPIWLGRAFALALLVAACVAAYHFGSRQPSPIEEGLYVDPKYLDFGEVWENPKFEWVLPIENRGDEDVHVVGFASSCRTLTIEPGSVIIPARGWIHARLNFDLTTSSEPGGCGGVKHTETRESDRQQEGRQFGLRLIPRFSAGLGKGSWVLSGRVRRAITLSTRRLYFYDDSVVRGQAVGSQMVAVKAEVPLSDVVIRHDSALFVQTAGQSPRYSIDVRPSPSLPPGPFMFEIAILPVTEGGVRLPGIPLRVEGVIMPDVQTVPRCILLGARSLSETVEETLLLRSVSGRAFRVESVDASAGSVTATNLSREFADSHALQLAIRVTAAGVRTQTLKLLVRYLDNMSETISVRVSYYGTDGIP